MDARSKPRADRQRMCALALGLCAASAIGAAPVEAGAPAPRFGIDATIQPRVLLQSSGGIDLAATLTPVRTSLVGSGFALDASVTASPGECTGDTIFANGFDM